MRSSKGLTPVGQLLKFAVGDAIPIAEYAKQKGVWVRAVYYRADIPKIRVGGRTFIPRTALAATFRKKAQPAGGDA